MRLNIIHEMGYLRKRRMRLEIVVLAVVLGVATPAAAGQLTPPVLVDRDLTVGAGATVAAAVGEAVARIEDAFVPARLFSERGVARRSANVTYRVFKLVLFDIPQESWLLVANHELMGHGGRLRERFDGPVGYTIGAPAPYGSGGGSTFFGFDREPTIHELMAISTAGMEADAMSARVVAERAFATRAIRPRDAIRYLFFELDTFDYVRRTGDEPERPGHDVSDFIADYNEYADRAGAETLAPRTLRREVLASLANPMLGIAAYAIGRYLWNGSTDTRVPALTIAGVRYLPLMRYQLTPYGTEWALTNHLAGRAGSARVDVRVGRAPGTRPWGIGIERRGVATWRSWHLDAGGNVWRQPRIDREIDVAPGPDSLTFGIEIGGRAERPLRRFWMLPPVSAIVDVRAKTGGFVPGEPIGAGVNLRAGVGIGR
jgi:hypothetical protein